jgi:hypothetical protein
MVPSVFIAFLGCPLIYYLLIFVFKTVEISHDLCYSITEVGQTEGFRLIMVKLTIDELAMLKESILKWSNPKGGSLPGYAER